MVLDKLLVIGAGPVGLGMAAALKARGVAYDQVDAGQAPGGNWQHGVYPNAHIVSSKRSTAYADYPMPADFPDFPNAAQMLRYLRNYARDKGLEANIECARTVIETRPRSDDRWHVVFEDGETRIYKGVVVCNGHHRDERWPTYPGTFGGEMMHAKAYREPAQLAGKRILVIGGGNSACDIASEAARVGSSSDLSLRSGYWFLPKTAFGRPLTDLPIWGLPVSLQRLILKGLIRLIIGDYRDYGLPHPNHRMFERHPTFGTEILGYIRQGRITPKPDIARFDGTTVYFSDGTAADYDLVVAATGYRNSFPFLPAGLIDVKHDAAQIYGGAFPANVKNLYIVGSNQPRNGFGSLITPAADLYARMIRLQDDLAYPIGALLRWIGEPLPVDNLVDPGRARRQIWLAKHTVFMLKFYDRLLPRFEPRERLAPEFHADIEHPLLSSIVKLRQPEDLGLDRLPPHSDLPAGVNLPPGSAKPAPRLLHKGRFR